MKAFIIPVTPFQQNCSVLFCAETMEGAVVDPGGEIERIKAAIEEHGVTITKILITHGHIDHAGAAADLAEDLAVPIEGPQEEDAFWIEQMEAQGARFGIAAGRSFTPDRWLHQGDSVNVGKLTLEVRYVPGHTPGHIMFFEPDTRVAFVGDVLFKGSVGRTDFPRGDPDTLLASIREQLLPLGDDVTFVPGHGDVSTFGEERRSNPFLREA